MTTPNAEQRNDAVREALVKAEAAMAEMFRYFDGGETRGSYDGKPERNQLRKAWYHARHTLAQPPAPSPLEGEDYRGIPGGYPAVAKSDLIAEASKLPDDFPNYGNWDVTLPAGHWRAILAALSTEAGRHPCPDILREDHNEAVDWITANCMAIRRDNGDMDYSLGAMIAAYEAGKAAIAEAGKPTQCEPMHPDSVGWSEWIHPLPGYLMQCCDCGLIHEMEFEIVPRAEDNALLNPGEHDGAVIIFRARRAEAGKPAPAEPVAVTSQSVGLNELAHEIWAMAQVGPGEGIEDAVSRIVAALAEPASPDEPLMVPRYATDAMMQAGLYHMPDGVEYEDLFTAWHAMFDAITLDGGCTTELPAEPASPPPAVEQVRCTMDVGCDEYGVCFAESHGEPDRCPKATPPAPASTVADDGLRSVVERAQQIIGDGYVNWHEAARKALATPARVGKQGAVADLIRRLDCPSPKALRVEMVATMREAGQLLRDLLATPSTTTERGQG